MIVKSLLLGCGMLSLSAVLSRPLPAQRLGSTIDTPPSLSATTGTESLLRVSSAVPQRSRPVSGSVKWGVVIGGVTGATVAAVLVLSADCTGIDCDLRKLLLPLPMGVGAAAGVIVGGSIGRAVDRSGYASVASGLPAPSPSAFHVGMAVPFGFLTQD